MIGGGKMMEVTEKINCSKCKKEFLVVEGSKSWNSQICFECHQLQILDFQEQSIKKNGLSEFDKSMGMTEEKALKIIGEQKNFFKENHV